MKHLVQKFILFMLAIFILTAWHGLNLAGDTSTVIKIQTAPEVSISFLDKPIHLKAPIWYVTGRIYLPLNDVITSVGGNVLKTNETIDISWSTFNYSLLKQQDPNMTQPFYFDDNEIYISLYDFTQQFHLAVVFDCKNYKLSFYNRQMPTTSSKSDISNYDKAYLRLEDITARSDDNGESLEKLRVIIDYLYNNGQSYYLAWIPLYTDPTKNIQNDLTTNFNVYNANFLYTLDYAVNHNGHILLHGLTHQELNTVSAIGTEFGKNTPFSKKQIDQRMKKTKEIAEALGYDNSIFEFPHTNSTIDQLKIAERNFDVIYQQNYYAKCLGRIYRVLHWNKSILYVPTPIGYIESIDKLPEVLERIDNKPKDQIMSLFIHPYVDFNQVSCENTPNNERIFNYDENGIFGQLVKKVNEKGFTFSTIDKY